MAANSDRTSKRPMKIPAIDRDRGRQPAQYNRAPGIMTSEKMFLLEHPECSVVLHDPDGNGLTILGRDDRDQPKLPGKIEMATNFADAVAKHVADGATKVDQRTRERRLEICSICEHRNEGRCSVCGCYLAEKAAWRSSECPQGRWDGTSLE